MKTGLSFLPDCKKDSKSPAAYFEEALILSKMADSAGMDYIKMTEHYLNPYGGFCPSPLIFLTAVAKVTQHIRLLTGCILPSFHHPIQLAAEIAMVDAISHGRLEVGLARAYLPYEFETLHVSMDGSRERYEETIKAMIDLWTNETSSWHNSHFSYTHAVNYPPCTSLPHPQLWGAAVNSRQTFSWLGDQLFNLLVTPPMGQTETLIDKIHLYRETFRESAEEKKIDKTPKVLMSIPLIICENAQEALRHSETLIQHYLDVWHGAAASWKSNHSFDYPHYEKIAEIIGQLTPASMRARDLAIVGTPSMVLEKALYLKEKYSLDGIIWQVDFGEMNFPIAKQTVGLFIESVLPNF